MKHTAAALERRSRQLRLDQPLGPKSILGLLVTLLHSAARRTIPQAALIVSERQENILEMVRDGHGLFHILATIQLPSNFAHAVRSQPATFPTAPLSKATLIAAARSFRPIDPVNVPMAQGAVLTLVLAACGWSWDDSGHMVARDLSVLDQLAEGVPLWDVTLAMTAPTKPQED